ncbi:MAG TPA: DUF4386 domain-containing protein [Balneolaceae bacterium]|nr:DUF4386 domain-containing protein [Balneolaceae bacterium]
MTNHTASISQHKAARLAGFMYLFALATAVYASFYVRANLVVWGDAVATANKITASEQVFRIGLAIDLFAFTGLVLLSLALYVLLKPVNKTLSLLALFWWLGQAFILATVTLNDYIVLIFLSDTGYLSVFETSQLQALSQVFLQAHLTGYNIGLIFFGLGSTVFSYLLLKSNYIPKILASFGIFASVLILAGTFAILIFPAREAIIYPFINPPIAFYELIIGLWLLFKGVNVQQAVPAAN